MIRSESRLERILHEGHFTATAEVVPPRSSDAGVVTEQARALRGYADAVNVTDNPTGAAHMSSVAGAALVAAEGLEPVLQLTTRDRNRLGLLSELLGGWAVGARNVLCLTGDPPATGDHPETTGVYDLDVIELVRTAASLRAEGREPWGQVFDPAPRYFIGVADLPLAEPYDAARLERKLDAGADFVQTQIVYDIEAFGAWADRVRPRGIFDRAFVLAGVAPLRNANSARFVREHLPGVIVPDGLVRELETAGDAAADVGVRITVEAIEALRRIPGISGIHVMGLGRERSVRAVVDRAGLLPRPNPMEERP